MNVPTALTHPDLQATANNVAYSAQVALGPSSQQAARVEATTFCNNFLHTASSTELCAVGLLLTSHSDPLVTRTGLQFIEHVAKFQWQQLQEREEVKERLFLLMQNGLQQNGSGNTGECPAYLQEALAKVIVEIGKREWPQLWPNLFPRLFEIASTTDLALLVLRRMVEDVATLQTVDCQERRRELSQSLTAIAPEVISTFFRVLVESVKQYKSTNIDSFKRRAKVCLGCLLPYIEWNNPAMFTTDNRIPILCALLPEPQFQMEAAECLSQLLERKPMKKDDRYDIPKMCLENDSFLPFLQAICSADGNDYDFLRKLGHILGLLATNSTVGKVNLENLFQGFEKFAMRTEAISVLGSTTAINLLLKNLERESVSSETDLTWINKQLTRLLTVILNKFVSSPNPTEKRDISRLKSEFSTLLRSTGRRVPRLYSEVNGWLHNSLSSPNAVQSFQWEALVLVIDAVASSVSHEDRDMVITGLGDLEKCHSRFATEQSMELKSLILSTVSALFVFLSLAKKRGEFHETHMQLMLSIFDSLFKCFHYEETSSSREIRRHSSSLLIKLASKFPDVMALGFDFIHSSAAAIAPKLTTMEYNSIIESLLITSNSWKDPVRQSTFIGSLFQSIEWQEISTISDSPQSLTAIFPENIFFDKKPIFIRNLSILYASLRRVKKAKSLILLQQNGNTQNTSASANGLTGNENDAVHPAYDHACPVLPVVLKLVKTIHSLLENTQLNFIMDLNETEKACVLGVYMNTSNYIITVAGNTPDGEKSHPDKLKIFVQNIQELAHGILGESSIILGPKFYTIPQLGDAYLTFVGHNSQLLDDFRLRGIIRSVFRPFLLSCPISQAPTVLKPFVQKFFPFMLERLVNRWTVIETAKSVEADGEEEREVIESSALRLLTKEYIELLSRLIERTGSPVAGTGNSEANMDMDDNVDSSANPNPQVATEIGEIGLMLLSDPTSFTSIVNCIVTCICWDDSIVCLKAARVILMTWDVISKQIEVVRGTFATTLRAVCVWVESEANVDSLLKILDACFKCSFDKDPTIPQMLMEWGAPQLEVQKLIGLCRGPKNEKKRKDLLRKLVHSNPSLERNKSPKSQWLRGLPQLKINPSESKSARQNSPEIDLNECFSLIHK